MFDTRVTVVGNLVAEPRLTFTKDGHAVASFRLASTPRRFDRVAGEWKDGDTMFTNVTCWRALAENVITSLKKGTSVIVLGRLSVRPYETKDGDKRLSVDIDALAVGPDLGRVVTIIKRAERGVPLPPTPFESTTDETTTNGEASALGIGVGFDEPAEWQPSDEGLLEARAATVDDDGLDDDLDEEVGADEVVDAAAAPVPQLAGAGGRWRSRGSGS
jgi:single-strand DNA-binding protein